MPKKSKTSPSAKSNKNQSIPYSLDELLDAGLSDGNGTVDANFALWMRGSQLAFALDQIKSEVEEILSQQPRKTSAEEFDEMVIEFAKSVRGCLSLVEMHRQRGEIDRGIDRALQAVTMWHLRPGKVYHTVRDAEDFVKEETQFRLKQSKQKKADERYKDACLEITNRKTAKPKMSYLDIASEMGKIIGENGKPKWGSTSQLSKDVTKLKTEEKQRLKKRSIAK